MAGFTTVGVAVAIPQPHATVLTNWRRRVGDPAAELVWPHVTLLPPTPVPTDQLAEVEEHLTSAAAQVPPFVLHLSGTDTFRPVSPVVFVRIVRGGDECTTLEKLVRSGPLDRELDFPYHPHVTVAQDVGEQALDDAAGGLGDFVARFPVDHIVLFSRTEDGRWYWRTEFTLGDETRFGG